MDKNTLLFSKVRDTKSPCRAHPTDAGIDFFLPNKITMEDNEKSMKVTKTPFFAYENGNVMIPPGGSILISTGIKCIIPKNHALIFFNKSGVASKKHLIVGACVCDECYRGEIHLNLINASLDYVTIEPGEKIAQAILMPVSYHNPREVDDIMNYSEATERGEGGFGSTGVK